MFGGNFDPAAATYSVDGSRLRLVMDISADQGMAVLAGTRLVNDVAAQFSFDKPATGNGLYLSLIGRRIGTDDYLTTAQMGADGRAYLRIGRRVGGVQTAPAVYTVQNASGTDLIVAPGEVLNLRILTTGSNPTTIQTKAWKATESEPSDWQITCVDSSPEGVPLQAPGSVGFAGYISSKATNMPVAYFIDNFMMRAP